MWHGTKISYHTTHHAIIPNFINSQLKDSQIQSKLRKLRSFLYALTCNHKGVSEIPTGSFLMKYRFFHDLLSQQIHDNQQKEITYLTGRNRTEHLHLDSIN